MSLSEAGSSRFCRVSGVRGDPDGHPGYLASAAGRGLDLPSSREPVDAEHRLPLVWRLCDRGRGGSSALERRHRCGSSLQISQLRQEVSAVSGPYIQRPVELKRAEQSEARPGGGQMAGVVEEVMTEK